MEVKANYSAVFADNDPREAALVGPDGTRFGVFILFFRMFYCSFFHIINTFVYDILCTGDTFVCEDAV